jgi:hypothetical protein
VLAAEVEARNQMLHACAALPKVVDAAAPEPRAASALIGPSAFVAHNTAAVTARLTVPPALVEKAADFAARRAADTVHSREDVVAVLGKNARDCAHAARHVAGVASRLKAAAPFAVEQR